MGWIKKENIVETDKIAEVTYSSENEGEEIVLHLEKEGGAVVLMYTPPSKMNDDERLVDLLKAVWNRHFRWHDDCKVAEGENKNFIVRVTGEYESYANAFVQSINRCGDHSANVLVETQSAIVNSLNELINTYQARGSPAP